MEGVDGLERQKTTLILQEHDALLGDVLGIFEAAERIDNGADRRIVDDACGEHAAQNAVHHIIETRLGHLSVFDRLLQGSAEMVVVAGHLLIEAGESGFDGAVSRGPVGENPALELEVLLEDLIQQVVVLAGPVAIHEVVGAHHGGGIGDSDGDLEGQQIGLAHGLLVELRVDDVASGLLIVDRVVLDVAHHVLRTSRPSSGIRSWFRPEPDLRPRTRSCGRCAVRA